MRLIRNLAAALCLFTVSFAAQAGVKLVTDETIKIQRDLTSRYQLKNGIPVVIRMIPDSDIVQVNVQLNSGLKDLPPGKKSLNEWLWQIAPMATTSYPKKRLFEITEKYSLELGCTGGIEYALCGLGTLNDYWTESLGLFAAVVTSPAITEEDTKLTKERLVAQLRNTPSDPGQYINEVVNSIFYPVGHPFRLNHDEALAELTKLGRQDLLDYHHSVVNAGNMSIVVVTSLPPAKVLADLEVAFGKVGKAETVHVKPVAPHFEQERAYSFNDRDLPTAYIRIKLNAPSVSDPDAVANRLLFSILSEELSDEIRTRRSLSYAVHANLIEYSIGIGVISASTSKPKETLEAIHDVLQALKGKTYTDEEMEEFKHGFATGFYITQETHASLANALGSAMYFYGDPNEHYELSRRLDKVTAADIKRLANNWLNNPRIGVIYGRSEFKDDWALDFIKKNLGATPGAGAEKKSH